MTKARKPVKTTPAPATRKRRSQADYLATFMATTPDKHAFVAASQQCLFDRRGPIVLLIRLPLAPSINHYWMQPRNIKHRIYSPEGRAYKEAVQAFWWARWGDTPPLPLTGRVRLLVVVHMARNGEADISNRIKPLEDALTDCGAYLSDGQIDDLRVLRGDVVPGTGAMDVTIETIGE